MYYQEAQRVRDLHRTAELRRLVLHSLENGSVSLAANFVFDSFSSLEDAKSFIEDCKPYICESALEVLVDIIEVIHDRRPK